VSSTSLGAGRVLRSWQDGCSVTGVLDAMDSDLYRFSVDQVAANTYTLDVTLHYGCDFFRTPSGAGRVQVSEVGGGSALLNTSGPSTSLIALLGGYGRAQGSVTLPSRNGLTDYVVSAEATIPGAWCMDVSLSVELSQVQ